MSHKIEPFLNSADRTPLFGKDCKFPQTGNFWLGRYCLQSFYQIEIGHHGLVFLQQQLKRGRKFSFCLVKIFGTVLLICSVILMLV